MKEYFKDKEPKELKDRLFIPTAVVLAAFLCMTIRLWHLQVMNASHFRTLSQTNRIRLIYEPAPRGLIFDRNGTRLAENKPGFDLSLVPEDVKDLEKTKEMLELLAGLDKEVVETKLRDAKRRPPFQAIRLKEDLTWEEMVRVSAFKYEFPGVTINVEPKRTYPQNSLTAHVLGYLGEIDEDELKSLADEKTTYRPGDVTGKYGIESLFEKTLKGVDGGRQVEVDVRGREIKVINAIPSKPGNNLRLTIDLDTQIAASEAMEGRAGAVIAADPNSGRILAMVSSPSYDPNALTSGISAQEWTELLENPYHVLTNRAIQGQYPPASTFKVVTAAAAMEEGAIDTDTKIFSGGYFRHQGHTYRDWTAGGHGNINVHRAIVESADTFFYQVGLKVGIDTLARYARGFGFGEKTGIELKNEKSGLVPTSEWKLNRYGTRWYEGETISVSVGQGYMLSTPLQLLNAFSAIANGGDLYQPLLVEQIETPDGEPIRRFEPKKRGTIDISSETLDIIRKALRGVVTEEGGTARILNWSKFPIAGKTGTAQVVRLKKRTKNIEDQPYKLRDHALFVGFAPYDDPKIAVVVIVEHGGFGARAAAPVALKVIETYLEKIEAKAPVDPAATTKETFTEEL